MAESLGISIGTANLVATPSGGSPTLRRSVLTLFGHRPPEVGTPAENPNLNERGLVLTGFVERVGDPVPLVAADGSSFRGERLMADALEALAREAGTDGPPKFLSATVPAYWRPGAVESLRAALRDKHVLSRNGEPMPLISEVVAALTALQAKPGLPARGIIALCDFGASGTSITLADAANGYRSVAPTVRYEDFSGELIDQAVLRQMLTDLEVDPSSTSAVVALSQVRDQCRWAKERLSYETATGLTGPTPGATVRMTRPELEALVQAPLDGVIGAIQETLQRNNIGPRDLVAVATVGGGARIPLVTERLSEALRVPVTTTPQAQVVAALGAALMARRSPEEEAATGLAAAPGVLAGAAAWAGSGPATATVQATASEAPAESLAWSEDTDADDIAPTDYSGYDTGDDADPTDQARPKVAFAHDGSGSDEGDEPLPPLPLYRRPGVLFGAAALLVVLTAAGLILTMRSTGVSTVPAGTSEAPQQSVAVVPEAAPPPAAPAAPPPEQRAPVVRQQAPSAPRRQQAPAPRYAPPRVAEPAAPAAPPPEPEAPPVEAPAPEELAPEPEPGGLIPDIPGFDPGALIPGGTPEGGGAEQPPTDP